MNTELYRQIAGSNTMRAFGIIDDAGIVSAWKSVGAKVNLVGSLRMGLMMKHRDIDFHVYTPRLDVGDSYAAMASVAACQRIERTVCVNMSHTDEACIEWHADYRDTDGSLWQIDVIHILQGSRYDGFFERVADRIVAVMTDEEKDTILRLKYETPDTEHIMGVEYYRAVISGGVRTFGQLMRWRAAHPVSGIVGWMP